MSTETKENKDRQKSEEEKILNGFWRIEDDLQAALKKAANR